MNIAGFKTGYLTKEGGRHKSWKKRFMVVEGHHLAYYKKRVTHTYTLILEQKGKMRRDRRGQQ